MFDAVILATGFGLEKNLNSSRSGSYWWSDHIKHYRSEHQHYATAKAYVSGNGDGSLIDYARFRSKARKEFDREEKNVALALMGQLRPEKFRILIQDGSDEAADTPEAQVEKLYKDAKDTRDTLHATGTDDHAAYEAGVAKFNDALDVLAGDWSARNVDDGTPADEDCARIAGFLENRFRAGDVKLVLRRGDDKDFKPRTFRPDATPANILLTALLMKGDPENHVVYGQVNKDEQKLMLEDGGEIPTTDFHVARNGTRSWHESIGFGGDLKKMIEDYDEKQSKAARANREEYVGAGHMQDNIIDAISLNLTNYEPTNQTLKDLKAVQMVTARHGLAQRFFAEVDSGVEIREMRLGLGDPARFVVTLSKAEDAENTMRAMGGIERNAYGYDVDFELETLKGSNDPKEVATNAEYTP